MKVLLVVPAHKYRDQYPSFLSVSDFPMGYVYIAAALRHAGHEVIGLNLNNNPFFCTAYEMVYTNITKALAETKPDLVGIGGLCIDYAFIKDAVSIVRQSSKVPIVLGGGIINNDAEFIFKLLKPDFCIRGEAEQAIVQLADMLASGKGDFGSIDNIGYWDGGKEVFTKSNYEYGGIDAVPFPDFESFGIGDMLDKYSMATRVLYRFSRPYPRPFIILTARGCPFNCTFCVHSRGPKYRARSIENVMEEIKLTWGKYRYNILIIMDELFAVNNARMRDFCLAVIKGRQEYGWDFDWMFQTHASAKLDAETLALAKKAGCFFFSYGIESASPTILESMNKKSQVPQIVEAIKLAWDARIGFGGNLIFGDPAETGQTIYESVDFFLKYCKHSMVFPAFLMPYPGSQIFDDCMKRGLIPDKLEYYENIDKRLYNMTSMSLEDWVPWTNFINKMSTWWWGVKCTTATRVERDDTPDLIADYVKLPIYKVWANCPYCSKEIMYRNILVDRGQIWLGIGCTHCNQKLKIDVPNEMLSVAKPVDAKEAISV